MEKTPQHTPEGNPSYHHSKKGSIVTRTNELLKWYYGCTSYFTKMAKDIIDESDEPNLVESIIADFLNDEAERISQELDLELSDDDNSQTQIPLSEQCIENEDEEDDELLGISRFRIPELEDALEVANHKVELYKAGLDGNIEAEARMMVDYHRLVNENKELKEQINVLLYGNQESGE